MTTFFSLKKIITFWGKGEEFPIIVDAFHPSKKLPVIGLRMKKRCHHLPMPLCQVARQIWMCPRLPAALPPHAPAREPTLACPGACPWVRVGAAQV